MSRGTQTRFIRKAKAIAPMGASAAAFSFASFIHYLLSINELIILPIYTTCEN
ncbi:MAG: hypothetical protein F6K22_39815 [Okeania sp. SIO2F4]|uniref:hypothetical protein n=1 Tax=Okeania sp. SIO2F4 TaxID=2607790 RepID=UPI001429765D|nr:hypothetical protein [Okeania sp. SIO2F4]NES08361.1 hypothetical protein [Okeania sp. SIO2F4]